MDDSIQLRQSGHEILGGGSIDRAQFGATRDRARASGADRTWWIEGLDFRRLIAPLVAAI